MDIEPDPYVEPAGWKKARQNGLKLLKFALKCHQTASVFLRDINWLQKSRLYLLVQNLEIVFCYQICSDRLWEKKCSSDWEKLLKFEAKGQEFAKVLRSLE